MMNLFKFPGFSYLALSTTAAFMQHLILYFWNRFEVMIVIGLLKAQYFFPLGFSFYFLRGLVQERAEIITLY
jgi:hypothetical protein